MLGTEDDEAREDLLNRLNRPGVAVCSAVLLQAVPVNIPEVSMKRAIIEAVIIIVATVLIFRAFVY